MVRMVMTKLTMMMMMRMRTMVARMMTMTTRMMSGISVRQRQGARSHTPCFSTTDP